jgi:hypothetical protein
LATAWHAHEIFVKYDASGHKTGALTFRLTAIAARRKNHIHRRSHQRASTTLALTALQCGMSNRYESACPASVDGRHRRFSLLCTNGHRAFATRLCAPQILIAPPAHRSHAYTRLLII